MFGFFIASGSAARKLDEQKIRDAWPADSDCSFLSPQDDIKIARFTPRAYKHDPGFVYSDDKKILVCVDGFIITAYLQGKLNWKMRK